MGDKLAYYALKVVKFIVNLLPKRINYYLAQGLGSLLFYLVRDRRELGIKNAQQALDYSEEEAGQLIKEVFQDLVLKTIEILTVEKWSEQEFKGRIEVEGWEHFQQAYQQERGVVLFTGHFGNWELLGVYFSVLGYPLNALAREHGNQLLHEEIHRIRESWGASVFNYRNEVKRAYKALLKNELLLIAGDQDARGSGAFIDFFDRPASTPKGPVVMAQKADSLVLPVYLVREEIGHYKLFIEPPLEIDREAPEAESLEVLQQLTKSLENKIKDYPGQWLWLHRRWKTEPEDEAKSPSRD